MLVVAGALLALGLVATGTAFVLTRSDDEPSTRVAEAVAHAPRDARRLLFTDWAAVRSELGLSLGRDSSAAEVRELLARSFETDLSGASGLKSSAVAMHTQLGFSPASMEWELLTLSESGSALAIRLGDGVTTDDVADRLAEAGYTPPDVPDGLWSSDSDVVPITAEVTPELAFVALDPATQTIYSSSTSEAASAARAAARAAEELPATEALDAGALGSDVVADVGDAVAAVMLSGAQACEALDLAQADPAEVATGEALLADAGPVGPLRAFALAMRPDGTVRVVLAADSPEQARAEADARALLASGPAAGQGGDFSERFALRSAEAEGSLVRLDVDPVDGAYVLTDLTDGPLLFAAC